MCDIYITIYIYTHTHMHTLYTSAILFGSGQEGGVVTRTTGMTHLKADKKTTYVTKFFTRHRL